MNYFREDNFMGEVSAINPEYSEWIKSISMNFRQCQIKAASKVNPQQLVEDCMNAKEKLLLTFQKFYLM